MKRKEIILVTGATGRQGGAVARALLEGGFRVRILARTPSKPAAVALQELGADIVRGDMEAIETLHAAMQGVHGVFSVQNYWEKGIGYEGEVRQGKNLADAARRANVAHFVQASIADTERAPGVHHFESKAVLEQYVDAIGLPRTFLGEVFYMENFLDPKTGAFLLPVLAGTLRRDLRFHLLSVEDIGKMTRIVFEQPERYIGTKIDLAGDLLTVSEMRETYARVTGRQAKGWKMPAFVLKLMMAEAHRQFVWNNNRGWRFSLDETRRHLPEPTSFETFLRTRGVTGL